MLFNSIDFAIFLPIVFIFYWFIANRNVRLQNLLIIVASFIFYGWWDWRFLFLLLISALIDFSVGIGLMNENNQARRKRLVAISFTVNLGLLGFFKYYNFFVESFIDAFTFFGQPIQVNTLNIILPVGISFYTFQTLSYAIDVYKRRFEPTRDLVAFLAFVSFFPQLVAGPIERATNLLPQFYKRRNFDYAQAVDGLKQILWGLFKKIVVADKCAEFVNLIFNNTSEYSGSTLAVGAVLFAFQIYGDFSGYSDIAIGTAKLFGFNLMRNFAYPYFSRNIAEFWRRWHISLSSWFKDYLYIPLGGSKGGLWKNVRNIFIVFLVSGFWHGANWTFIIWGALHALFMLPLIFLDTRGSNTEIVAKGRSLPSLKEAGLILFTFSLTTFAWIFFRAENATHAFDYIAKIFSASFFTKPELNFVTIALIIFFFMIIEWLGREQRYAIENLGVRWPKVLRWSIYYSVILAIYFMGKFTSSIEFIYFQF